MENNPEIDTTTFVNVDDEPFDIYINNKLVRHLEVGERQELVVYVAQVGAKHLVDRILQKQGIKDTLRDTDIRRNTFAKILPNMAEERDIKPLTSEQETKKIKEMLEEQAKLLKSLEERGKGEDEKEKRIKELEATVEKLVEQVKAKKVVKNKTE